MTKFSSHPWITFAVDLKTASPQFWHKLGQCQSKIEHLSRVPLRPGTEERLYEMYLAKGLLATTAIEGNTLSEEEVIQHLRGELELPPSRAYLAKEIDNILEGCNAISSEIQEGRLLAVTRQRIEWMNTTVLRDIELEDGEPGGLREHEVGVGRYKAPPPSELGQLVDELCNWMNSSQFAPAEGLDETYAVVKAVISHIYVAWIHPFSDGNGRTARLLEFDILMQSGIPAASCHLLSNHYNLTRTEYYRQLDRASRSGGDILPFLEYAVQGFLDGLKDQLDVIWEQQHDIIWRNFVYTHFGDPKSEIHTRRRRLVLDLSRQDGPVPLSELGVISTKVAREYSGRDNRTLVRDVHWLAQQDLVEISDEGVRPRKERILAFLPTRAKRLK